MLSKETYQPSNEKHVVQYGVWSDCCNNCDFCLRVMRRTTSNEWKISQIRQIQENIKSINWARDFAYGISLLGGELFYIRNKDVQNAFMELIDDIIEYVLIPCPKARFSTVTNGIYKPDFLYRVIDRIVEKTDITRVDVNFSYDLKYRYKSEIARQKAYNNINNFQKRYNYGVGVQMILTQNLINLWKEGKFDVKDFMAENFPNCNLQFLYPHPIHTGRILDDFFFKRNDFLAFLRYLKERDNLIYLSFINSTKNSATFKYTGLNNKISGDTRQIPILSGGKEEINPKCGHSILYKCYADSDKCILCDIKMLDGEL